LHGANIPLSLPPTTPGSTAATEDAQSFADFMLEAIGEVNAMQHDADHAVEQLVSGGEANMAEVFTAVQKADMSFRMLLQIRNKMLQAYDEIKDIRI
ncbi:MAG: flagellar hook-basal body complex protein FliE, partial [Planctomycetes bacterium]|nr:flagellar hook-basal body complex protein FliE [Planctomycetota bacterium]